MNNDEVQDLIVQSFNGHVLCFNGVNSEVYGEDIFLSVYLTSKLINHIIVIV